MPLFRILDLETVPDVGAWTPSEPKWLLAPIPPVVPISFNISSAPAMTSLASMGLELKPDAGWPPPQANKIVALSWLTMESITTKEEGRRYEFKAASSLAAWGPGDERRIVSAFGDLQTQSEATLVTWAGRSFDLPVLAMRALKLGLDWGWYYRSRSIRYRYSDDGHCDLMDALSDYGAARPLKLGDAARLVGLPGKTDMDGSKVADVVALGVDASNQTRIARYCAHDVIQTALVFLRSRVLFGYLTLDGFRASAESFKQVATDYQLPIDWDAYLMLSRSSTP
jgi:hypothetical protein